MAESKAQSNVALVLGAWFVVAVPLAWGVLSTFSKAAALFK
ncbi:MULTISPECIES: hypothetical protein [Myxococcaceae]|nr:MULTISPECIES: hypothetical protein [Myxococcaceae]